jgi:hypothetical protein
MLGGPRVMGRIAMCTVIIIEQSHSGAPEQEAKLKLSNRTEFLRLSWNVTFQSS